MAYLDFSDSFATAAPVASSPVAASPAATGFSPLEWSVVALAAFDRPSSLDEPGRIARALGSLFGLAPASRLADERLEALRRFAIHAWRDGYVLAASEIGRFVEAGFTLDQVETLLASVAPRRIDRKRRAPA